ncbi:MAG: GatB/YqeY domain-containing protein [Chloroflexi bacterium]|nr:MAG: GatB/YqeY domain-containing protein [Chloroflexota bacterium]
MHPKEQIQQDLKDAMKSGNTRRRELLRLLMAAFKQVEVDQRKDLTESDAISILMTEAKKRREAIDEANRAGRTALAEQEKYELAAIEAYLPRQLSHDEIEKLVREAVQEVGATTPKDMGKVMKVLMPRVQGQADGKLVNSIVKDVLG